MKQRANNEFREDVEGNWRRKIRFDSMDRANVATGTISAKNAGPVSFTVTGKVPSMKNRRELYKNHRTGRLYPAKSEDAQKYADDFYYQVPARYRNLKLGSLSEPLRAIVTVYHVDRLSDLDCSLVYDCLQAAGVIANDRFLIEHHEFAEVDRANPRCDIHLEFI